MLTRALTWGLRCSLAGLILAGCGTGQFAARKSPGGAAADREDFSPDAMEARIEAHASYAAAVIDDLNGRQEEAVEHYLKAALLDPEDESLVLSVTRRFLQLKELEKAVDILEKSTESTEAGPALFVRLAGIHGILGHTNRAIMAAEEALKRGTNYLPAYQQLARLRLEQRQDEEGLEVLRQALRLEDVRPDDSVALAEICLSMSARPDGSREALKDLAKDFLAKADKPPTRNPSLAQRMADAYLFLADSERASELYLRLLEDFPHLPALRERLVDLYLKQQDVAKASNQLESVVRDTPTNIRAHYLLGSLAYDAKDYEKARDHFEKVLLLNGEFEPAYFDLAGVYLSMDKAQEALDTLDKARDKFKLRFVMELYSALAHSRLKQFDKAVKHYEAAEIVARATETNRLTHMFYFQIGAAYERNKQYREAESYFRKCLAMAPEFSEAMNYLGYMWAERGENLEESHELIEKAVTMEPENAAYLDSLAWVLFKLNKPQEALPHLLKALENSEEPDAVLFDHLGDIYAALDQRDKAEEAWKRSLELEPNEEIERKVSAPQPEDP